MEANPNHGGRKRSVGHYTKTNRQDGHWLQDDERYYNVCRKNRADLLAFYFASGTTASRSWSFHVFEVAAFEETLGRHASLSTLLMDDEIHSCWKTCRSSVTVPKLSSPSCFRCLQAFKVASISAHD
jgi:hypothetical protein